MIADYSQIELRILAEVSEDPEFVRAFRQGEDLHRLTAATMYGVEMEEVSKDQRSAAKRINFGLMYGRGAKSLSAQLGTDEARGAPAYRRILRQLPESATLSAEHGEQGFERPDAADAGGPGPQVRPGLRSG